VFEHRTVTSRHVLRLCVLGTGLLIASPAAHAQLAVIDNSNLAENLITAAQMLQAVAQLKAQLAELETTYAMFTNPQNILSMNRPGFRGDQNS
jgi:conjugal transfer/entry exclusion protein